jgi:hypothetical protein
VIGTGAAVDVGGAAELGDKRYHGLAPGGVARRRRPWPMMLPELKFPPQWASSVIASCRAQVANATFLLE